MRQEMCDFGADLTKAEEDLANSRAQLEKGAEEWIGFAQGLKKKYDK